MNKSPKDHLEIKEKVGKPVKAQSLAELRRHCDNLEELVSQRTAELKKEVNQRKKSENKLHTSLEYLDTILSNMPAGLAILEGSKFKYFRINQQLADINGLSIEEHLGRPLAEVLPQAAKDIVPVLQKVFDTGESTPRREFNTRLPKDHDEICHFIDAFFPIKGQDGKVEAVGAIVIDITERKKLEKQILDVHENLQHKISNDLHDSLGQHLTGLAFKAKILQEKMQTKSMHVADEAAEIVALANQAIVQTRSLARGLYPGLLKVEGLESALLELTTDIGNLFGIRCYFKSDMVVKIPNNGETIHLYRIAQEAIHNSIIHGNAKQIWVELTTVNEKPVMKIKNDGHDFAENPDRKQGMGIEIMQYRARMINASLVIHSDVNGGTVVTCTFS